MSKRLTVYLPDDLYTKFKEFQSEAGQAGHNLSESGAIVALLNKVLNGEQGESKEINQRLTEINQQRLTDVADSLTFRMASLYDRMAGLYEQIEMLNKAKADLKREIKNNKANEEIVKLWGEIETIKGEFRRFYSEKQNQVEG